MNSFLYHLARWRAGCMFAGFFAAALPLSGLAQEKDPYAPKPEIPEGFMLVGGDILVPLTFHLMSPYSPNPNDYWPGGVVPYEFDANVTAANQSAMLVAMAQWQNCATVQFVVRTSQSDYVHIQSSTGNSSSIGRVGGRQYINIYNWNSTFIMAHELGHCLAFDHTQTRSDRGSFVTINYANIQPAFSFNFDVHVGFNDYGPYDFDSVMHYDQCAFSIDCAAGFTCACARHVIDVLPPNDTFWQSRIGQRAHLSRFDQLIMSFLYPQWNWRFVDRNYGGTTRVGTFIQPYVTFADGEANVPAAGTVWLQPGTYSALGTHTKAMTLKAPLGGVTLSN